MKMKTLRLRSCPLPRHKLAFYLACFTCLSAPFPTFAQGDEDVSALSAVNAPALSDGIVRSVDEIVVRPDEDLLIFTLNLGRTVLLDALLTYEDLDSGKYYIPLIDFFETLEFPIQVDEEALSATGWFLSEDRVFSLNLREGIVDVSGTRYSLDPKEIERHEDGIYVSLEELQKWFPVTLDVDFSQLAVVVKSLEPLPIEIRLARDIKRQEIDKAVQLRHRQHPIEDAPAPAFGFPFMNTTAQLSYEDTQGTEKSLSASVTTLASAIVAGQDFLVSVNESTVDDEGADVRASIGLKAPDNNLFGVGGSEYKLGDVNTANIPFLATGSAGRGVSFSTMPLNASPGVQSGNVQLRGELPVGYQVDIMRNGQLIGFLDEPDSNGEYIFDVDVLPGLNIFELVFYGPQGQKETREERFYVPSNPVKKGAFGFKTDVIQDDTNLFTNRGANNEDQGEYRVVTEAQYGLTGTSSLYGAFADLSVEGDRKRYGLLRYSQSLKGIRADLSYAHLAGQGYAAGVRFQSIFKGISWQVQHEYYQDFLSEQTLRSGLRGELEHSTNVRLSGLLPLVKNMPFSLRLDRLSNLEGVERYDWNLRLTNHIKKLRITSEIDQRIESELDRETNFNLQIGSRYDNISLRGALRYELEPEFVLNTVSFNADWRIDPRRVLRAGIRRSGSQDPVHALTLGGSYLFDPMQVGMNVSYDDNDELRAVLSSSFSLGYNPYKSNVFLTRKRTAETAMFAPRAYYDKNGNSEFDDEDEWLKDIHFSGSRVDRKIATNEEGYSLLTGIAPYARSTLELNSSSLPDPFMRSVVPPRDYVLRPGQIVRKDFPVILVGEVDGDVSFFKAGSKRPAQSISVQLLAKAGGEVVAQGASEYDGFIWLQDVPMGQYEARVDPQQLKELGYCDVPSQDVALNVDEPFSSVNEFVLWPKQKVDNVSIYLLQDATLEHANALWVDMLKWIKDIFLDQDQYPASYIIEANVSDGDGRYSLILTDVKQGDASLICEGMALHDYECIIQEAPLCPANVVEIKQIPRGPENFAVNTQDGTGEEGEFLLDEGSIKDISEKELQKIIDN